MRAGAGKLQRFLQIARTLFLPLALVFLALAAYAARDSFGAVLAHAHLGAIALVVLTWSLLHLLGPVTSWIVLSGLGTNLGYRKVLRIHVSRLPARYIPGGIWQTVSRVVDLQECGVTRAQLSVLVAMENIAPLAVVLAFGSLCALVAGREQAPVLFILAAGVLAALALPWALRRFFPSAALPLRSYLLALGSILAFWALAASAFVLYWAAFPSLQSQYGTASLFASYLLAWAAGFVAVFAPQGVGVFEVVAGLLLDGTLPLAGMAVMIAGFRASTLVGDGFAYVAGVLVHKLAGKPADMH